MDEWRLQKSNQQFSTLISMAVEGEAIEEGQQGMIGISKAAVERLKSMDREGITQGPATRMLVGLSENYDQLGLSAIEVRKAFNQASEKIGKTVKDLVPALMPFMQGRDVSRDAYMGH